MRKSGAESSFSLALTITGGAAGTSQTAKVTATAIAPQLPHKRCQAR